MVNEIATKSVAIPNEDGTFTIKLSNLVNRD